jgi:DNA repair protein RadA/Sms
MICQGCGFGSELTFVTCPLCHALPTDEQPTMPQAQPIQAEYQKPGTVSEPEAASVVTGTPFDLLGNDGMPVGCTILLAGAPGLGKSEQCRALCARWPGMALYCSYEERPSLVTAKILRWPQTGILLVDNPKFGAAALAVRWFDETPLLVIVDSLQTAELPEEHWDQMPLPPLGGSMHTLAVRSQAASLAWMHPACTVVIIGHATKADLTAGPRAIEHLVDTVIMMRKDREGERLWHVTKNRMGRVGVWPAPLDASAS